MIQKIFQIKEIDIRIVLEVFLKRIHLIYLSCITHPIYLIHIYSLSKKVFYKTPLNLPITFVHLPESLIYRPYLFSESVIKLDIQRVSNPITSTELSNDDDYNDYPLIPLIPFNLEVTQNNIIKNSFKNRVFNYIIYNFKP